VDRVKKTEPYPELTISFLQGDTEDRFCTRYPDTFYEKFTAPHPRIPDVAAYQDGCSIIVLPETFQEYWDGAAGYGTRRKLRRAEREGYRFASIVRDDHLDDIFEINTSMEERQGKPMTDAYRTPPKPYGSLPEFTCPRHSLRTYGVLLEDRLVAYSWVYQIGQMCLFSTILGHGEHLANGTMYLLVAGAVRDLIESAGTRYAMYNMHLSGTDGLRFFKEQMGFRPYWVTWQRCDEAVESTQPPV
jgi:hypothetical protein